MKKGGKCLLFLFDKVVTITPVVCHVCTLEIILKMIALNIINVLNMEKYNIEKDLKILYVQAASFPYGVGEAYQKLHTILPDANTRTNYGISHMTESGHIVYKAGVEESYPGEGAQLGCDVLTVRKGTYASELLLDWKKDETVVGKTFQKLLQHPELDKKGYCLEIFQNGKDVLCLVPLV